MAEFAVDAARGLDPPSGSFRSYKNDAGGTIHYSEGGINGNQINPIVEQATKNGEDVTVLSGVDGFPNGMTERNDKFLVGDTDRYAHLPNVTVRDYNKMTKSEVDQLLAGPGTVIGGFCNSGVCLGVGPR